MTDHKTPDINASQNNRNSIKVTLLGTEGTGKTCFLAGLACIGFDMNDPTITVQSNNSETATYLGSLRDSLQSGTWPSPTSITSVLDLKLSRDGDPGSIDIFTIDYPGEDFRDAFNQMSTDRMQRFSEHLMQSDVIVLLVDAKDIENAKDDNQKQAFHNKLRANLTAAFEVAKQHNQDAKSRIKRVDICIGITKCDMVPVLLQQLKTAPDGEAGAAARYFHGHLGNFDKILRQTTKIKDIRYFTLSAVGLTRLDSQNNTLPAAGQIQPMGYDSMFRWIAERPERIRKRRCLYFGTLAVIMLAVVLGIAISSWGVKTTYDHDVENQILTTLNNTNLSVVDRLMQTQAKAFFSEKVRDKRLEITDNELDRFGMDIRNSEEKATLEEKRQALKELNEVIPESRKVNVTNLQTEISKKLVAGEFQRVKDASDANHPEFLELADRFLENHPKTSQAENVREMIRLYREGELQNARDEIKKIRVTNREHLAEKSKRIFEFISIHRDRLTKSELTAMERAATLARQFSENHTYKGRLIRYGGFAYKEDQIAYVLVNGRVACTHKSNGRSKEVNPSIPFTFQWQCGDSIQLKIEAYAGLICGGVETVADRKLQSPTSLKLLTGQNMLTPWTSSWDWSLPSRMAKSGYFIQCQIEEISDEDWEVLENYITLGSAW